MCMARKALTHWLVRLGLTGFWYSMHFKRASRVPRYQLIAKKRFTLNSLGWAVSIDMFSVGNCAACYRIENRGTPENSWGGCWEECCENSGCWTECWGGCCEGGFPWKGIRISTPSSTKERHTQKTTHPNKSSLHKQFAQTISGQFVQTVPIFPSK